jgi:Flp pilus assembly protein CpaB
MKNKLPLVIALLIGVASIFAIKSYIGKQEEAVREQLKGDPVVAASTDIPPGTELTIQMLVAKQVPRQFIPAQAIEGEDQVKQILGSKTRVPIHAGNLILWSDLASESHAGLSSIIPVGEGAFSVSVTKGVKSNLIQPSDHVDIVGSFAVPKPQDQPTPKTAATWRQASDIVNVVLLQNVTVLAVGESYAGQSKASTGDAGDLTLALTLPEAQLLMFASQNGELGTVLRREGAAEVVERDKLPRVTFEALEKIIGDLDGQRNFRTVEIQKGTDNSATVPVENSNTNANH